MRLFSKLFKKKKKNVSLMYFILLFEDFDHQFPDYNKEDFNNFALPIMWDIVELHYASSLDGEFTYDYMMHHIDLLSKKALHMEFRDMSTKEIVNKAKYKEMCSGIKSSWKNQLLKRFPKYNREAFEVGMEKVVFDYFPSRCVITASFLLSDILKPGIDKFHE